MPVWHERTRALRARGELHVVGIVQDQHADRARLFLQWRRIDWPVLIDSLNRTDVRVVPRIWYLCEKGIVQGVDPRPSDLDDWQKLLFPGPLGEPDCPPGPPQGPSASTRTAADRWFLSGKLDEAIAAYEKAMSLDADDSRSRFRLGVALRRRFESPQRRPGDFRRAAAAWTEALELNPDQYIWRRRIQQYGPRLGKPYNFFGWVEKARREIAARGETPVALAVEPSGAETAGPMPSMFRPSASGDRPPYHGMAEDQGPSLRPPWHLLTEDKDGVLPAEVVAVPTRIAPGKACKLHVILRAPESGKVVCDPELEVDIMPPAGWRHEPAYFRLRNFGTSPDSGVRAAAFELHAPADAEPGPVRIPIRVVFGVKTGTGGKTVRMRRELEATVTVRPVPARTRRLR